MARGMFLPGSFISPETYVAESHPSNAHRPEYSARAYADGLVEDPLKNGTLVNEEDA
jgi:hypothetical protein